MRKLFILRKPWMIAVSASLGVICLTIFAGDLQNLVASEFSRGLGLGDDLTFAATAGVFLVLFVLFSLLTWHNRSRLLGVRLRDTDIDSVRQARCLIFFVSRQIALTRAPGDAPGWRLLGKDLSDALAPIGEDGDACRARVKCLDATISEIMKGHPAFAWQQILRGVYPHLKHVREIHLVGSSGEGGTFPLARDVAMPFLKDCLGPHGGNLRVVSDELAPEGVDFEDFGALKQLLTRLVQRVVAKGVPEQRIVIDITGGQKVAGVAAAALTLEFDATFQYVQTSWPHRIRHYDIEFVSGGAEA